MALKSPLMPSPTATGAGTSVYTHFNDSPSSPVPFSSVNDRPSKRSSTSDSLQPPPSPYPQFVDPSPVDSNGTASTDTTEIDDDGEEGNHYDEDEIISPAPDILSPAIEDTVSPRSTGPMSPDSLTKLDTSLAARTRADSDGAPQSVIHAPQDFKQYDSKTTSPAQHTRPSPTESSTNTTILSPSFPPDSQNNLRQTSPINTNLNEVVTSLGVATPQAQTRQELEEEFGPRRRPGSSLEDIPETLEGIRGKDAGDESYEPKEATLSEEQMQQIEALQNALSECWVLCNTLANLSLNHRKRIFNYSGRSNIQEHAWQSCWKLCQNLYESRDEDHSSLVLPTLEMCRDFCQALFDARSKGDEVADSVLRVSFELNNHLYNTHDRNLPPPFQERTLDFYLTLCHRLMKQRTSLPEETDTLLRACWSLAEMLFSLRQTRREGKPPDEELLGSAVQACWELCDLFREGWTQVRPDRGTPRPSQTTFSPSQLERESNLSMSPHSLSRTTSSSSVPQALPLPPETPTTIYDDQNDDDGDEESNAPGILVLGPSDSSSNNQNTRVASSASTFSERTSSTTTVGNNDGLAQHPNLNRIRILLVKAAINTGFQPRSPPGSMTTSPTSQMQKNHTDQLNNQSFHSFVKSLPSNSFGPQQWQISLLERYRKLVIHWPTLIKAFGASGGRNAAIVQTPQKRVTAAEVARAVQWMVRSDQYAWLKDLFRVVFGSYPDDALNMTGVVIQA